VVIDIPHAFLLLAREIRDSSFTSRVVRFTTASDVVRWVPNPAVSPVSASLSARIDTVRAAFAEGRGPALVPTP
jgi:hypothetical protein